MHRINWASCTVLAALAACGGSNRQPAAAAPPVAIPIAADAGSTPDAASFEGGTLASTAHPLPKGANGPTDATGMIGEAGKVVADSEVTLLVNSESIRKHPLHEPVAQLVTTMLAARYKVAPDVLVDPVRDSDWVIMAGPLSHHSVEKGTLLAHYNLSESKADALTATLLGRFKGARRVPAPAEGAKAFSATVGGVARVFVRPKPGVLAVVPHADTKRVSEHLRRVDVPNSVRPNELGRLALAKRGTLPNGAAIPAGIRTVRAWIETTTEDHLLLAAEGECADEETAEVATGTVRQLLAEASSSMSVRLAVGGLVGRTVIYREGRIVRLSVDIEEQDVRTLAALACMGTGLCGGHR